MLKKVVFAAALTLGFVTSFHYGRATKLTITPAASAGCYCGPLNDCCNWNPQCEPDGCS
jgi:hypothetical protein